MVGKSHQCNLLINHPSYPKHCVLICGMFRHSLSVPDHVVLHDRMNTLVSEHVGHGTVHKGVQNALYHFLPSYVLRRCDILHTSLLVLM